MVLVMRLVARGSNQLQRDYRTMIDSIVTPSVRTDVLVAGLTRPPGLVMRVSGSCPTTPLRYILGWWRHR